MTATKPALPPDLAERLLADVPAGGAVYFLFSGDDLVYIGSSLDPALRIWMHGRYSPDAFNRAMFLPVTTAMLRTVEAEWIARLGPRYNRKDNPSHKPSDGKWYPVTKATGWTPRFLAAVLTHTGWTDHELACKTGITPVSIERMLEGRRRALRGETIARILKAAGLKWGWLDKKMSLTTS